MPCVYGGPLYLQSPSFLREGGFLYKNNMGKLNKIFKISSTDFATLKETGQITKAGVTYKYDPDNLYLIENNLTDDYVLLGAGGSKLESELSVKKAQQDGNGAVIANTYVKKVSGKDLSTNDYTTAEKTKLAGIEAGANKITKVSQLTNDEHYINNSTLYEAKLKWGGDNFSGTYGPMDAALVSDLGANRLALLPAKCIDVEYSRDGGVTWNNYTTIDTEKTNLFTKRSTAYSIGGKNETNVDKSSHQLRITIKNTRGVIYNNFIKFVLYVSTNGSAGCWCTIDGRLQSDVEADNDTWKIFINKQHVSGWSGYNVINYPNGITTYSNNKTRQYGNVRFTFGCTSHNQNYGGLHIMSIQGFGGEGWETPSTLALTGHLYEISATKAATFPGKIYATELMEGNIALSNKYAPLSSVPQSLTTTDIDDAIK